MGVAPVERLRDRGAGRWSWKPAQFEGLVQEASTVWTCAMGLCALAPGTEEASGKGFHPLTIGAVVLLLDWQEPGGPGRKHFVVVGHVTLAETTSLSHDLVNALNMNGSRTQW